MPERHPFTESEDAHLIKFIAINNPDASGRNGNKLYKTLVENPKRWPWSKSHPWQSWRERYKKNSVWFDRKIRRYLRVQKEAKEAAAAVPSEASTAAEGSNQAGGQTAKGNGPVGADKHKRMAASNQQTSTTLDGRKPIDDGVKTSKDAGNSSTDSGYASTTKKTPDESEKKHSTTDASEHPNHKPATKGRPSGNTNPSSLRSQSTVEPPKPASATGQEVNVSQTEESSAEEGEQGMSKGCNGEDDYMHELFGSYEEEEEEEEVAEPEDPPASSAPSSPSSETERIYPDLRDANITEGGHHMDVEITRHVPPSQSPPLENEDRQLPSSSRPSPSIRHPAELPHSEKRQLKRKVPDDDPFVDSTPPPASPTPEQHTTTRKALPVLNDGPFRNRYVRTRKPGENAAVAGWPPNRKRNGNEAVSRITELHAVANKSTVGRKVRQQVNAVASSSKVQLTPSTALRPDDPFLIESTKASQLPVPMPGAVLPQRQPTPDKTIKRSRARVADQPPTKRQKLAHLPVSHRESTHGTIAPIPTSSPAYVISNSRSNSFANIEGPAVRRIDFRESLKPIRSARSSRGSITQISNSITNHDNRRNSAASSTSRRHQRDSHDESAEFMFLFERDLAGLGERYGFALGVVKKLYMQFGTLEKTVKALRALNKMMREVQNQLPEEMQRLGGDKNDDTDDEESIPDGVIPKNVSSLGAVRKKETGEEESHNTPNIKRHRPSLTYKPFTTDAEDHSEYSPPSRTRAGRYAKLQKAGREEEALIAASGGKSTVRLRNESSEAIVGGVGEVRHGFTTVKRGMEPSSPLGSDHERPTTSYEGEVVGRPETRDEEWHDEEDGDGDIELSMNISPARPELREPTPEGEQGDDEEPVWRAEHKKLCSEVTLEHQGVLSAFEKGQDGDPWRTESRDWLGERFSNLKRVQEIRKQEYYRNEAKKAEELEEYGV